MTKQRQQDQTTGSVPAQEIGKDWRAQQPPTPLGKARKKKQNEVKVTFNVTVPPSTHELNYSVFLAGTLHQMNTTLVDWDTRTQKMEKTGSSQWTITLTCPENAVVEYKYCLGDWDHVERDEHCGEIPNRRVTLTMTPTGEQVIHDYVSNWRHVSPCGW